MKITLLRKDDQVGGAFDGGRIRERKSLGFPQDRGELRPYGNLFYWAYAWAEADSLIGEHPHKGFEIMSFVLKGGIEHYDSKLWGWKKLEEGDVQIIRAGSGITHAEKLTEGSEMFQIWFDPGLERTLDIPASYDDYRAASFPEKETPFGKETLYTGEGGVTMMAGPLTIRRTRFSDGEHLIPLPEGMAASHFVLGGGVGIGDDTLAVGDFLLVTDTTDYRLRTTGADVFTIVSSLRPDYRTYQEMMQARMGDAR